MIIIDGKKTAADLRLNLKNEIDNLKKGSLTSIEQVAEEIASKVVEDLTNEKLNQSSVKAIVSSTSKKRIGGLLWSMQLSG